MTCLRMDTEYDSHADKEAFDSHADKEVVKQINNFQDCKSQCNEDSKCSFWTWFDF